MLKGTCNHQDHAGVGVAMPDALQFFPHPAAQGMGSNAYQFANPPTPELLDACDKWECCLGGETAHGHEPGNPGGAEKIILRDRKPPCVLAWSLGNEEWMIEGNEKGAQMRGHHAGFR